MASGWFDTRFLWKLNWKNHLEYRFTHFYLIPWEVFNFLSEAQKRNLFDDSQITKFEEFIFSLKKLKEKTKFQCQFCSLSYVYSNSLKLHINSVHNEIRYKCTGCGISYRRKDGYNRHIKKCKLANISAKIEKMKKEIETTPMKKISQTVNFTDKKIIGPPMTKKFRCQFCSLSYSRKHSLNSHIDYVHNGIRYKCTGCGNLRQQKNDCVRHIKKCRLANIHAQIRLSAQKNFLGNLIRKWSDLIY